jgi:hypothetical protein
LSNNNFLIPVGVDLAKLQYRYQSNCTFIKTYHHIVFFMSVVYPVRSIAEAPECLVTDGKYSLGCFNSPVKQVNLLDASSTKSWVPIPRFLKNIQLREWQAFQIKNNETFVMIAIYNAKKVSLVQFIVYNLETKSKLKYEKKCAPWDLTVPSTLFNSTASYTSNDFSINVYHDIPSKVLNIDVNINNFENLPNVKAQFQAVHDVERYTPMVVCNPFSSDRVMYSHKCLMPVKGALSVTGTDAGGAGAGTGTSAGIEFSTTDSQLIIDDHKGYYPYVTVYDWVTGLGRTESGKLIGFNLTHNQVIDQEKYNENCLWLDGVLFPLPPVTVSRPKGVHHTWVIKDQYDMVHLEFEPVTHTSVHLNYVVLCSEYEGPYGYFNGYVRKGAAGVKVQIVNMFGMGEDFYLKA